MVFRELVLRGFGPHAGELRVRFDGGLTTVVGPNEWGKSTLVAGLVAVLFGLPGSGDPARLGKARFRHRHGARRFEGELELVGADGRTYRIHRDFETHHVRLVCHGDQGPEVAVEGYHNPSAARRILEYEARIAGLLGLGSRELFVHTFCVEQPMPDVGSLAGEVQALLSGSGRSYQAALDSLGDRLRGLTRYTGDLGVTDVNLHLDRPLEHLATRIRELERAVEQGRQEADELEALCRRQAELAHSHQEARQQLKEVEQAERDWQEWRIRLGAYRERAARRTQLAEALGRARQLEARLQQAEQELRARWPEFLSAPADTGERLEEVARLAGSVQAAGVRMAELERLRRQAEARTALACWQRFCLLRERLAQMASALEARYQPFAEAAATTLEWVRRYPLERAHRQEQLRSARQALEAAEGRHRELAEQARYLAEAYADVVALAPEAVAAMDRKMELLEGLQHLEGALAEARARRQRRRARRRLTAASVLAALLAAVGAGLAAGMEGGSALLAGLAASVAVLVALAWWSGRAERAGSPGRADPDGVPGAVQALSSLEALEDRRARLVDELRAADAHLGLLAHESPARLGMIRQRRAEWQARLDELEQQRLELPPEEELAALRIRMEEAEQECGAFEEVLRPFTERYPDLAAAYREWEGLSRARRQVAEALQAFCREEWDAAPEAVEALAPQQAGPIWADLAQRAHEAGGERAFARMDELGRWLEDFPRAVWDDPEAERASWDGLPPDFEARLRRLEHLAPEQRGRARSLADEAARLRRAREADLQRLAAAVRELGPVLAGADGARGLPGGQAPEAASAPDALDARNLEQARQRWREYGEFCQQVEAHRRALAALLEAQEAAGVADLARRAGEAADAALVARRRLEELSERRPGLPGPEEATAPAVVDQRLAELKRQGEQLRDGLERLERELYGLRAREAQLTGGQPLNVAAAELELLELRRRRQEMADRVEALALAHRELREAVREFQASHRERLQQAASRYFAHLTGRPGRRVELSEAFQIGVLEADGGRLPLAQLSRGTRDQLYLSLRLAIGDLVAGDLVVPFIFDDAFVNCDDGRLERLRQTLQAMAAERQVLVLSHRRELAAWGTSAGVAADGAAYPGAPPGPGGGP